MQHPLAFRGPFYAGNAALRRVLCSFFRTDLWFQPNVAAHETDHIATLRAEGGVSRSCWLAAEGHKRIQWGLEINPRHASVRLSVSQTGWRMARFAGPTSAANPLVLARRRAQVIWRHWASPRVPQLVSGSPQGKTRLCGGRSITMPPHLIPVGGSHVG